VEAWRLIPYRKADAAENMAVDEAIFRRYLRAGVPPTLRFYGWQTPTVSLGHFQDASREIDREACRRLGVAIVRRPTGGRAVLHEDELTYAVIAGSGSSLFPADIQETYRLISRCIIAGLREAGIAAEMKAEPRPVQEPRAAACFAVPSRYELLVAGRKICGAAQMRSRGAFLQHGSLLMRFDPARTCAVLLPHQDPERQIRRLRDAVTAVAEHAASPVGEAALSLSLVRACERLLGVRLTEGALTPAEEALRDELVQRKYGCESWNWEGRQGQWISGL
jgi:lipoate-protein ligase A